MAFPSLDAYGAIRPAPTTTKGSRSRFVAISASFFICMSATVFFLSRPNTSNVEMEAYTPKEKLSRMVKEFAINGASMTVREMESKLDQWRHDPATLLDLPEDARSQVSDR